MYFLFLLGILYPVSGLLQAIISLNYSQSLYVACPCLTFDYGWTVWACNNGNNTNWTDIVAYNNYTGQTNQQTIAFQVEQIRILAKDQLLNTQMFLYMNIKNQQLFKINKFQSLSTTYYQNSILKPADFAFTNSFAFYMNNSNLYYHNLMLNLSTQLWMFPSYRLLNIFPYMDQVYINVIYLTNYSSGACLVMDILSQSNQVLITYQHQNASQCHKTFYDPPTNTLSFTCPHLVMVYSAQPANTQMFLNLHMNYTQYDNYSFALICQGVLIIATQKMIIFYQTTLWSSISTYNFQDIFNSYPIFVTNQVQCLNSEYSIEFQGIDINNFRRKYRFRFNLQDSNYNYTTNYTHTTNVTNSTSNWIINNNNTVLNISGNLTANLTNSTVNGTNNTTINETNNTISNETNSTMVNEINNTMANTTNITIANATNNSTMTNGTNNTILDSNNSQNTGSSNINSAQALQKASQILNSSVTQSTLEIFANSASIATSIYFLRQLLKPFTFLIQQLWYYGTHKVQYTDFFDQFTAKSDIMNMIKIKPTFISSLQIKIQQNIDKNQLYQQEKFYHSRFPTQVFFLYSIQDIYTMNFFQTAIILFITLFLKFVTGILRDKLTFLNQLYYQLKSSLTLKFIILTTIESNLGNVVFYASTQLRLFFAFNCFSKLNLIIVTFVMFVFFTYCFVFYWMVYRFNTRIKSKKLLNFCYYGFFGFWVEACLNCHRRMLVAFVHSVMSNSHFIQILCLIIIDIYVVWILLKLRNFFKDKITFCLIFAYFLLFLALDCGIFLGADIIFIQNLNLYRQNLIFNYYSLVVVLLLCSVVLLQILYHIIQAIIELCKKIRKNNKIKNEMKNQDQKQMNKNHNVIKHKKTKFKIIVIQQNLQKHNKEVPAGKKRKMKIKRQASNVMNSLNVNFFK